MINFRTFFKKKIVDKHPHLPKNYSLQKSQTAYTVTYGTEFVGRLTLRHDAETDRLWITNLSVIPEHRDKGIAKYLVYEFEKDNPGRVIYLRPIPDKNGPFNMDQLITFYKKLGFKQISQKLMAKKTNISEDNTSAALGTVNNHGGEIPGGGDWYAPGDYRTPHLLGQKDKKNKKRLVNKRKIWKRI